MLENVILIMLIMVEISFLVWSLFKKSTLKREKSVAGIALFVLFLILAVSPIIDWGMKWLMLSLILGIGALFGVLAIIRRKVNQEAGKVKIIFTFIGRIVLIGIALFPILLFPQYDQPIITGNYGVATKSFTLTDQARNEDFTEEANDKRKVTIQFWYPSEESEQGQISDGTKFPLVIFSHGAFGLRSSNYSTFQELASNGYVVCSIDHTYHAFMTQQEDGKAVITDMDFMNDAMKASNGELSSEEIYELEKEWMELRTGDMAFVFDYIKNSFAKNDKDGIFDRIDLDHVGLFGHSLGGATAAQIGRECKDIDAIIVLDGTMLGEISGFENGKELINDTPYPKPLLNFYSESHYSGEFSDNLYPNRVAQENAVDAYQVVIKDTEHMNFTDLPIVSPFLANLLGTGTVDPKECTETINKIILEFFDHYLKTSNVEIPRERLVSLNY